jgi:hypothetical protein
VPIALHKVSIFGFNVDIAECFLVCQIGEFDSCKSVADCCLGDFV